jgi:hypothetical protein
MTVDSEQIVTKESATFGLPGHRETILGLDADHSNICKFDSAIEDDMDVYEFVKNNFLWLYDEVLKERNLETRMAALDPPQEAVESKFIMEIRGFSMRTRC